MSQEWKGAANFPGKFTRINATGGSRLLIDSDRIALCLRFDLLLRIMGGMALDASIAEVREVFRVTGKTRVKGVGIESAAGDVFYFFPSRNSLDEIIEYLRSLGLPVGPDRVKPFF